MRKSCCDISSLLNSLCHEEVTLIQSQFLDFLTTIFGRKPNHGMKAKGECMGKELSIRYEDTPIGLSLNHFLLRTLGVDHTLKCSSSCAYFEKQLLVSVARIKLSHHDLELLYDNLFIDLLVAHFSSSCASMWSKIHILLESLVESGYDERISWLSWSLSDVFHAKLKGEFVEKCDYESSFLYASMKTLDGFIPSIELLCFVSHRFEFPYNEQNNLLVYPIPFINFLFKYDILNDYYSVFFPTLLLSSLTMAGCLNIGKFNISTR
ncbi:hypothetical protein M9H77_35740 [Catharanthus roseus]|uniref:Uncharacterized protein n=1 Tax=Catharanthus roseus TaxID=4058 RepID=A0ACB9ZTK3_CATRO|nr:hypothetical protein M9H77_35740 [Catharanthus roseus]